MRNVGIDALSRLLWLVPNWLPGKVRLGRALLRPFLAKELGTLSDSFGCRFVLPSFAEPIALELFTFGAYEAGTRRLILDYLSDGGIFLDVGANIGALSIPITKMRPNSSVICLEADPNIFEILTDNLEQNDCTNAKAISCVAGADDGKPISFYRAPKEKFGMGSIGQQFDAPPLILELRTADSLLAELGIERVDVIKIDVEGAELGVLRGARNLLSSQRPPVVVFEFADWAETRIPDQSPGDAQLELFSHGYRLFRVNSDGTKGKELSEPMRSGGSMILALPTRVGGDGTALAPCP